MVLTGEAYDFDGHRMTGPVLCTFYPIADGGFEIQFRGPAMRDGRVVSGRVFLDDAAWSPEFPVDPFDVEVGDVIRIRFTNRRTGNWVVH